MTWQPVLRHVLEIIYEPLMREQVPWAILGSVASALQGCRVDPRDVDFLAADPQGVYRVAELMSVYAPPTCDHPCGSLEWCSSQELPVHAGPDDYGFAWHFARWFVDGFRVEVAHIAAPEGFPTSKDGAGIWEAGPEIWPHLRRVPFAGYQVPVVPLEIQMETNLSRGLEGRTQEIMRIFRQRGYDRVLLRQALCRKHSRTFDLLVQEKCGLPALWFFRRLA